MKSLEQKIYLYTLQEKNISFSVLREKIDPEISDRSIKRHLTSMVQKELLLMSGGGRSVSYKVRQNHNLMLYIEASEYLSEDLEKRNWVNESFDFERIKSLKDITLTSKEKGKLHNAYRTYQERSKNYTDTAHKKELERFIIELSWKSSQIEGNTYTLLDTERLIRFGIPSEKNTASETQMILNHKKAFDAIYSEQNYFKNNNLSVGLLEEIHKILVYDLGVESGVRNIPVGITGTKYTPLSLQSQIKEAISLLFETCKEIESVEMRALALLVGISYIQPFEDGNKRTARMLTNGILLATGHPMLSYRTTDEIDYKERILVFYEIGSIVPMKELFIEQYEYAANHYARKLD